MVLLSLQIRITTFDQVTIVSTISQAECLPRTIQTAQSQTKTWLALAKESALRGTAVRMDNTFKLRQACTNHHKRYAVRCEVVS